VRRWATASAACSSMTVNGRMTHLKHAVSGNPIYEMGYGYDAVGNRVYKEDLVNSTRSEFYDYDHRDRLRNACTTAQQ